MAFPVTYRGKLEFPLSGDPEIAVERFYEEASYKISRSIAIDADVSVAVEDGKLIVSYTVKFKVILVIISVFVFVLFGIHFYTWDLFLPPGLPKSLRSPRPDVPLTIPYMISVMGLFWLWFSGMIYCIVVVYFRSLLRAVGKNLRVS